MTPIDDLRSALGNDLQDQFRLVILDTWDGPTLFLATRTVESVDFIFELVDWCGDPEGLADRRVFSVSTLPPGTVRKVVDALPKAVPVNWPVWNPAWRFSDGSRESRAKAEVDSVLPDHGDPEFVVAAEGAYRMKVLVVHPLIDPRDVQAMRQSLALPREAGKAHDWFKHLGLERLPQ